MVGPRHHYPGGGDSALLIKKCPKRWIVGGAESGPGDAEEQTASGYQPVMTPTCQALIQF